jgi:hypothetical protein
LASKVSNNFYQAKTEEIYRDLDTKAIASVVEAALLGKAPTNHQHQITEVTGLETALSEKAIASEMESALLSKAPTNHQHGISEISDLEAELAAKSEIGHEHQIQDVFGMESILFSIGSTLNARIDAKADQDFVNPAIASLQATLNNKANTSDVTTALAGKSNTGHGHAISDTSGLQAALDAKADQAFVNPAIASLQATLNNKANTSDVTTALAGKSNTGHGHAISDTSGLQAALDAKAPINIITSTSVPTSPFSGLIWNEVASDGELIEAWRYVNSKWQSLTKYKFDYFGASAAITGTSSYHLPLDTRYNYLFKDFLVHCLYSVGTVDVGNYWRAIITTQPSGTTFADTGAIGGDNLSKRYLLNYLFVPATGERLIFNPQKLGVAPSAKIAMSLTYHLVRK